MGCRKSDTQNGYTFKTFGESENTGAIAVHRVEMLNLLSKELTADTKPAGFFNVHFSKRMTSYTQDSSGVTLNFEDGSFAQADILIGADGIGSPTRKTMYTGLSERARGTNPEHADHLMTHALPIWTGIYIYRFLVDSAKIQAIKPDHIALSKGISWCGSGSHSVTYPISSTVITGGVCTNIPGGFGKTLSGPTGVPASKEEMKKYVNDWEDDLRIVIENAGEVTKWAISQVRPLPQFVDAKVALLGDSAHAMVPYIGAGAGQAIEDAFILGRLLASPLVSRNNIADVLKVYEDIRKPISQDAASRSLKMGHLMELRPDYLPGGAGVDKVKAGDHVQLEKVANAMQDVWSFHSTNMPGEYWERASEMLVQILEAVPRKDEDDV